MFGIGGTTVDKQQDSRKRRKQLLEEEQVGEIILLKENINMARIMEGDREDLSSSQEGWGRFFAFFKECGIEWELYQQRSRILMSVWNLKNPS